MTRALAGVVCCLCCLLAGCAWTGSDEAEAPTTTAVRAPSARWIAYADHPRDEVWIARLDGRGKRRLVRGGAPAVSPDGRWVVFAARLGEFGVSYGDLWIVAASGGRPRLLVRGTGAPVWSPDSTRVAALQPLTLTSAALLSIEVESGKATTVARGSIHGWSFSPTGDEIAYARAEWSEWGELREDVDIYVANAEGGDGRRVTDDGDSAYPVWGPHAIAFARLVPFRGWGAHEIWLVQPDGSRRRLLTKTPRGLLASGIVGLRPIAWSADGRALLTALANEFGGPPYVVDVPTGRVRGVGAYSYHAWPAGLSRDGRAVLVADTGVELSRHTRIEIVPLDGSAPRVLARFAGDPSWNA